MSPRILIVDDQQSMLQLYGTALEANGYEIDIAQDARTALGKIKTDPPDLVILDVVLPEVSGLDLLGAIRSDPKTVQIPAILLSALSSVEDKIAGLQTGADEYLTKPIDTREMVARVEALLQRTARLREGSSLVRGIISTFIGAKGGVGTTTIALNIAVELARQGLSVAATELRPSRSDFAHHLRLSKYQHLGNLITLDPQALNPTTLKKGLTTYLTGLQILCSFPETAEEQECSPEFIDSLLEALVYGHDFVVIDLPHILSNTTEMVIAESNYLFLVVEPTPICLSSALSVSRLLTQWAPNTCNVGCVIVNRSAIASSLRASEIESQLHIPVIGTIPQAGDILVSSYRRGQLLILEQPNHAVSDALRSIAKMVMKK